MKFYSFHLIFFFDKIKKIMVTNYFLTFLGIFFTDPKNLKVQGAQD